MEKWYTYLKQFLPVVPWHGIRPDGVCTCGIRSCTSPGDHPIRDEFPDCEMAWELPYGNIAIDPNEEEVCMIEVTRDGRKTWQDLKEKHSIRRTWVCEGPKESWLIFFKFFPELNVMADWGVGVDVRASYALAPPSLRPDGSRVKWLIGPDECELGIIPGSLKVLVSNPEPLKKKSGITWRDAARIDAVKSTAAETYIRRLFWSQEGKLSGEERREWVTEQALRFNTESTPPMRRTKFSEIISKVISDCESSTPIPKIATEAMKLFNGHIVDHIGNMD